MTDIPKESTSTDEINNPEKDSAKKWKTYENRKHQSELHPIPVLRPPSDSPISRYGRQRKPKIDEDYYNIDQLLNPKMISKNQQKKLDVTPVKSSETVDFDDLDASVSSDTELLKITTDATDVSRVLKLVSSQSPTPFLSEFSSTHLFKPIKTYTNRRKRSRSFDEIDLLKYPEELEGTFESDPETESQTEDAHNTQRKPRKRKRGRKRLIKQKSTKTEVQTEESSLESTSKNPPDATINETKRRGRSPKKKQNPEDTLKDSSVSPKKRLTQNEDDKKRTKSSSPKKRTHKRIEYHVTGDSVLEASQMTGTSQNIESSQNTDAQIKSESQKPERAHNVEQTHKIEPHKKTESLKLNETAQELESPKRTSRKTTQKTESPQRTEPTQKTPLAASLKNSKSQNIKNDPQTSDPSPKISSPRNVSRNIPQENLEKPKRGRSSKRTVLEVQSASTDSDGPSENVDVNIPEQNLKTPRRGRSPKKKIEVTIPPEHQAKIPENFLSPLRATEDKPRTPPEKRKRGRTPKKNTEISITPADVPEDSASAGSVSETSIRDTQSEISSPTVTAAISEPSSQTEQTILEKPRRGRKPKKKPTVPVQKNISENIYEETTSDGTPQKSPERRRRGRPWKKVPVKSSKIHNKHTLETGKEDTTKINQEDTSGINKEETLEIKKSEIEDTSESTNEDTPQKTARRRGRRSKKIAQKSAQSINAEEENEDILQITLDDVPKIVLLEAPKNASEKPGRVRGTRQAAQDPIEDHSKEVRSEEDVPGGRKDDSSEIAEDVSGSREDTLGSTKGTSERRNEDTSEVRKRDASDVTKEDVNEGTELVKEENTSEVVQDASGVIDEDTSTSKKENSTSDENLLKPETSCEKDRKLTKEIEEILQLFDESAEDPSEIAAEPKNLSESSVSPVKRRRGRMSRKDLLQLKVKEDNEETASTPQTVKRKRGRKPWKNVPEKSEDTPRSATKDDNEDNKSDKEDIKADEGIKTDKENEDIKADKEDIKAVEDVSEAAKEETSESTEENAPKIEDTPQQKDVSPQKRGRGRRPWKNIPKEETSSPAREETVTAKSPVKGKRGRKPWKHLAASNKTEDESGIEDAVKMSNEEIPDVQNLETLKIKTKRKRRTNAELLEEENRSIILQLYGDSEFPKQAPLNVEESSDVSDRCTSLEKPKRGRSPKKRSDKPDEATLEVAREETASEVVKPRRGRSPKKKLIEFPIEDKNEAGSSEDTIEDIQKSLEKPKRGRSPKKKLKVETNEETMKEMKQLSRSPKKIQETESVEINEETSEKTEEMSREIEETPLKIEEIPQEIEDKSERMVETVIEETSRKIEDPVEKIVKRPRGRTPKKKNESGIRSSEANEALAGTTEDIAQSVLTKSAREDAEKSRDSPSEAINRRSQSPKTNTPEEKLSIQEESSLPIEASSKIESTTDEMKPEDILESLSTTQISKIPSFIDIFEPISKEIPMKILQGDDSPLQGTSTDTNIENSAASAEQNKSILKSISSKKKITEEEKRDIVQFLVKSPKVTSVSSSSSLSPGGIRIDSIFNKEDVIKTDIIKGRNNNNLTSDNPKKSCKIIILKNEIIKQADTIDNSRITKVLQDIRPIEDEYEEDKEITEITSKTSHVFTTPMIPSTSKMTEPESIDAYSPEKNDSDKYDSDATDSSIESPMYEKHVAVESPIFIRENKRSLAQKIVDFKLDPTKINLSMFGLKGQINSPITEKELKVEIQKIITERNRKFEEDRKEFEKKMVDTETQYDVEEHRMDVVSSSTKDREKSSSPNEYDHLPLYTPIKKPVERKIEVFDDKNKTETNKIEAIGVDTDKIVVSGIDTDVIESSGVRETDSIIKRRGRRRNDSNRSSPVKRSSRMIGKRLEIVATPARSRVLVKDNQQKFTVTNKYKRITLSYGDVKREKSSEDIEPKITKDPPISTETSPMTAEVSAMSSETSKISSTNDSKVSSLSPKGSKLKLKISPKSLGRPKGFKKSPGKILPKTPERSESETPGKVFEETRTEESDLRDDDDMKPGMLFWARVSRFPYWPCIIDYEPGTDLLRKSRAGNRLNSFSYHVIFFGDSGKRSWVPRTHLFPFKSRNDLMERSKRLQITSKNKLWVSHPNHPSAFVVLTGQKYKWNTAVTEAESISRCEIDKRIETFKELLIENARECERHSESRRRVTKQEVVENVTIVDNKQVADEKRVSDEKKPETNSEFNQVKLESEIDEKSDVQMERKMKKRKRVTELEDPSNVNKKPKCLETIEIVTKNQRNSGPIQMNRKKLSPKTRKNDDEETKKSNEIDDLPLVERKSKSRRNSEVTTPKPDETPQIIETSELNPQAIVKRVSLFKGVHKTRVCQICLKRDEVYRCKGFCGGLFHVRCERKLNGTTRLSPNDFEESSNSTIDSKDTEDLTFKNVKDYSSDSNSSRGSKNRKLSVSCPLSIAEQIDLKMQEVMKGLVDTTKYADSATESDSDIQEGGEDKSVVIIKHVTGDDVVQQKVFRDGPICYKCTNCQLGIVPSCFICGKNVSKTGNETRMKCSSSHCMKYYHRDCLKDWPQTKWSYNNNTEILMCPYHICHTCTSDDPRAPSSRLSYEKLTKCMQCPTTYHSSEYCVPAGSEILSMNQIICPKHYQSKNKLKFLPHINASWCFICSMGGSLICCETCPASFHSECLKINLPEGGYICEECESGRLPLYNEVVWVKLGMYRWWPAQILYPTEIPQNVSNIKHNIGEFAVKFFGTYDHYWVNRGRVFLFQDGDSGHVSNKRNPVDTIFLTAIEEALIVHKSVQQERNSQTAEWRIGMKPPMYIKIKANRPVGNVRVVDGDTSNTTPCDCDPRSKEPCGPDSDCLNRILLTECDPLVCAAGERCHNQQFEKRKYAPVVPFRTNARGWGLKCLAPIKKGSFVIEYVGEIIEEQEYQKRIKRKHELKDENYYFLTIDKDRMIDAGPKGNVARFMNHSCSPNCETQKWTVNGDTRVGLFAICDIPAEVELTFNYNLECIGEEKKICRCGAENCSGFIGVKVKQDEKKRLKNKKKTSVPETITTESVQCFNCGEMDAEQICTNKNCLKHYHLKCINQTEVRDKNWYCPRHNCNACNKRTQRYCYLCTNAYCPSHSKGNIRYDETKFVCKKHDKIKKSKRYKKLSISSGGENVEAKKIENVAEKQVTADANRIDDETKQKCLKTDIEINTVVINVNKNDTPQGTVKKKPGRPRKKHRNTKKPTDPPRNIPEPEPTETPNPDTKTETPRANPKKRNRKTKRFNNPEISEKDTVEAAMHQTVPAETTQLQIVGSVPSPKPFNLVDNDSVNSTDSSSDIEPITKKLKTSSKMNPKLIHRRSLRLKSPDPISIVQPLRIDSLQQQDRFSSDSDLDNNIQLVKTKTDPRKLMLKKRNSTDDDEHSDNFELLGFGYGDVLVDEKTDENSDKDTNIEIVTCRAEGMGIEICMDISDDENRSDTENKSVDLKEGDTEVKVTDMEAKLVDIEPKTATGKTLSFGRRKSFDSDAKTSDTGSKSSGVERKTSDIETKSVEVRRESSNIESKSSDNHTKLETSDMETRTSELTPVMEIPVKSSGLETEPSGVEGKSVVKKKRTRRRWKSSGVEKRMSSRTTRLSEMRLRATEVQSDMETKPEVADTEVEKPDMETPERQAAASNMEDKTSGVDVDTLTSMEISVMDSTEVTAPAAKRKTSGIKVKPLKSVMEAKTPDMENEKSVLEEPTAVVADPQLDLSMKMSDMETSGPDMDIKSPDTESDIQLKQTVLEASETEAKLSDMETEASKPKTKLSKTAPKMKSLKMKPTRTTQSIEPPVMETTPALIESKSSKTKTPQMKSPTKSAKIKSKPSRSSKTKSEFDSSDVESEYEPKVLRKSPRKLTETPRTDVQRNERKKKPRGKSKTTGRKKRKLEAKLDDPALSILMKKDTSYIYDDLNEIMGGSLKMNVSRDEDKEEDDDVDDDMERDDDVEGDDGERDDDMEGDDDMERGEGMEGGDMEGGDMERGDTDERDDVEKDERRDERADNMERDVLETEDNTVADEVQRDETFMDPQMATSDGMEIEQKSRVRRVTRGTTNKIESSPEILSEVRNDGSESSPTKRLTRGTVNKNKLTVTNEIDIPRDDAGALETSRTSRETRNEKGFLVGSLSEGADVSSQDEDPQVPRKNKRQFRNKPAKNNNENTSSQDDEVGQNVSIQEQIVESTVMKVKRKRGRKPKRRMKSKETIPVIEVSKNLEVVVTPENPSENVTTTEVSSENPETSEKIINQIPENSASENPEFGRSSESREDQEPSENPKSHVLLEKNLQDDVVTESSKARMPSENPEVEVVSENPEDQIPSENSKVEVVSGNLEVQTPPENLSVEAISENSQNEENPEVDTVSECKDETASENLEADVVPENLNSESHISEIEEVPVSENPEDPIRSENLEGPVVLVDSENQVVSENPDDQVVSDYPDDQKLSGHVEDQRVSEIVEDQITTEDQLETKNPEDHPPSENSEAHIPLNNSKVQLPSGNPEDQPPTEHPDDQPPSENPEDQLRSENPEDHLQSEREEQLPSENTEDEQPSENPEHQPSSNLDKMEILVSSGNPEFQIVSENCTYRVAFENCPYLIQSEDPKDQTAFDDSDYLVQSENLEGQLASGSCEYIVQSGNPETATDVFDDNCDFLVQSENPDDNVKPDNREFIVKSERVDGEVATGNFLILASGKDDDAVNEIGVDASENPQGEVSENPEGLVSENPENEVSENPEGELLENSEDQTSENPENKLSENPKSEVTSENAEEIHSQGEIRSEIADEAASENLEGEVRSENPKDEVVSEKPEVESSEIRNSLENLRGAKNEKSSKRKRVTRTDESSSHESASEPEVRNVRLRRTTTGAVTKRSKIKTVDEDPEKSKIEDDSSKPIDCPGSKVELLKSAYVQFSKSDDIDVLKLSEDTAINVAAMGGSIEMSCSTFETPASVEANEVETAPERDVSSKRSTATRMKRRAAPRRRIDRKMTSPGEIKRRMKLTAEIKKSTASSGGVEEIGSSAEIEEMSSPAGIEGVSSPAGIEGVSSSAGIVETSSSAKTEEMSSSAGIEEISSSVKIAETSSSAKIEEASSCSEIEEKSSVKTDETTSSGDVEEPASARVEKAASSIKITKTERTKRAAPLVRIKKMASPAGVKKTTKRTASLTAIKRRGITKLPSPRGIKRTTSPAGIKKTATASETKTILSPAEVKKTIKRPGSSAGIKRTASPAGIKKTASLVSISSPSGTKKTESSAGIKRTASPAGVKSTASLAGTSSASGIKKIESSTGIKRTASPAGTSSPSGIKKIESPAGIKRTASPAGVKSTASLAGTSSPSGIKKIESSAGITRTASPAGLKTSVGDIKRTDSPVGTKRTSSPAGDKTSASTGVKRTATIARIRRTASPAGDKRTASPGDKRTASPAGDKRTGSPAGLNRTSTPSGEQTTASSIRDKKMSSSGGDLTSPPPADIKEIHFGSPIERIKQSESSTDGKTPKERTKRTGSPAERTRRTGSPAEGKKGVKSPSEIKRLLALPVENIKRIALLEDRKRLSSPVESKKQSVPTEDQNRSGSAESKVLSIVKQSACVGVKKRTSSPAGKRKRDNKKEMSSETKDVKSLESTRDETVTKQIQILLTDRKEMEEDDVDRRVVTASSSVEGPSRVCSVVPVGMKSLKKINRRSGRLRDAKQTDAVGGGSKRGKKEIKRIGRPKKREETVEGSSIFDEDRENLENDPGNGDETDPVVGGDVENVSGRETRSMSHEMKSKNSGREIKRKTKKTEESKGDENGGEEKSGECVDLGKSEKRKRDLNETSDNVPGFISGAGPDANSTVKKRNVKTKAELKQIVSSSGIETKRSEKSGKKRKTDEAIGPKKRVRTKPVLARGKNETSHDAEPSIRKRTKPRNEIQI